MMKKFGMTLILLVGMLCVPSAMAVPVSMTDEFVLPTDPSIKVTVASSVEETSPGEYLYTYQVRGIGDLNIISLSVPFLTPLTEPAEVYDFAGTDAATLYWGGIGGNPAAAAYALFNPHLLPNGITTEYQFKSIHAPQVVTGFVDEAQMGSLYGDLYAPIPEPATLSILAIGTGLLFRKKMHNK